MEDTKIESLRCNIEKLNGNNFQVLLQEVKFMPELWVNLRLLNEEIIIHLSKGSTTLSFERVLKTKNGFLSGVRLNPISFKTAGNLVSLGHMKANLV
jgi:hypothetical protein